MDFINILIQNTITASILIFFILLFRRLFQAKINPHFQYAVWGLVIIRLLMISAPASHLSVLNVLNNSEPYSTTSNFSDYSQYENTLPDDTIIANTSSPFPKDFVSQDQTYESTSTVQNSQNYFSLNQIKSIIIIIWFSVAIILIIYIMIANILFRKRINIEGNFISLENQIKKNCLDKLSAKKIIPIVYTKEVSTPCLVGIFKPIIAIPENTYYSSAETEYIIIHEMLHYKRKDYIINYIKTFLKCIYWFNPLVHIAGRASALDCEISIDKKVMKITNNKALQYGKTLISVINQSSANNKNNFIMVAMTDKKNNKIKKRIQMLANQKKNNIIIQVGVFFVVMFIGITTLTSALGTVTLKEPSKKSYESLISINTQVIKNNSNESSTFNIESEVMNKTDNLKILSKQNQKSDDSNFKIKQEQMSYNSNTQIKQHQQSDNLNTPTKQQLSDDLNDIQNKQQLGSLAISSIQNNTEPNKQLSHQTDTTHTQPLENYNLNDILQMINNN